MTRFDRGVLRTLGDRAVTLEDIIGQEHAKEEARKFLLMISNRLITHMYGFEPPNLLLHGQPGTGKTMTVEALAYETIDDPAIEFYAINLQDVGTAYVNETANNFRKKIDTIMYLLDDEDTETEVAVVFMDEFDSIALSRWVGHHSNEDDKLVNAVNNLLDGEARDSRIAYIAATNCYKRVDPAIKSRFAVHVEYSPFEDLGEIEMLFRSAADVAIRKSVAYTEFNYDIISPDIDYSTVAELVTPPIDGRTIRDITERAIGNRLVKMLEKADKAVEAEELIGIDKVNTEDYIEAVEDYNMEQEEKKTNMGFDLP